MRLVIFLVILGSALFGTSMLITETLGTTAQLLFVPIGIIIGGIVGVLWANHYA